MSADEELPPEILAGEYVLGLLGPEETAALERRLERDRGLRRAVAEARERFLELDTTAAPATVSPGLWPRIAAVLARPAVPPARRGGLTLRFGFWPGALAGAAVAALLALLALFLPFAPAAPPQPVAVAVLLDAEARPGAIVEAFADDSVAVVPLLAVAVPEGQVPQLWTLPDPATGPVSLGLLPAGLRARLTGPDLPPPQPNQLYEITLEPAGGSPTGRPTGPILFKGYAAPPL